MIHSEGKRAASLRARHLGIDTYQEPVIYMRRDCPICRSEGFEALSGRERTANDSGHPQHRDNRSALAGGGRPGDY